MQRAMTQFLELRAKNPKLKIYATDGDFHQYVLDTMEEGAASNGFFGMVFAFEKCEKVTLYGFHKVRARQRWCSPCERVWSAGACTSPSLTPAPRMLRRAGRKATQRTSSSRQSTITTTRYASASALSTSTTPLSTVSPVDAVPPCLSAGDALGTGGAQRVSD